MRLYSVSAYADVLDEEGLLVSASIFDETEVVLDITYNSKECREGTLFACKGAAFKKEYLDEAVSRGISCYVAEKEFETQKPVNHIIVNDIRKAMALIADLHFDKAYEKLNLIGVTGTKGKSTTAYYIKYILDEMLEREMKKPSGIVSSIDTYDGVIFKESHLTTPEAFELHRHFDNAAKSGLSFFEMEVSSQALKYDRVLGVKFDAGVFLNISEDHISPVEHSDFEDYFGAKLKLFSQSEVSFVNLSSDFSERVLERAKADCKKVVTFGYSESADFYGHDVKKIDGFTHFKVKHNGEEAEYILEMPGLFNVENALAAIAVCNHFGIPTEIIKEGLRKARSSGRMEVSSSKDGSVVVIVDYAHNKLSFEALYKSTLEEYKGREIITVFGCPGGKAYNRRVELGFLAGKYSNRVYLTAEDPGYEEIHDISLQIKENIKNNNCEVFLVDDRGEAIKRAVLEAKPNSVILITGKGNETRQKIKSEYVPCLTDTDYAKEALQEISAVKVK